MFRNCTLLTLSLFLSACSTAPVKLTDAPMTNYDKSTKCAIEENGDNVKITINRTCYQFMNQPWTTEKECKEQLISVVQEHSEKTNRQIKSINEKDILLSLGRNDMTAISSCEASIIAKYVK